VTFPILASTIEMKRFSFAIALAIVVLVAVLLQAIRTARAVQASRSATSGRVSPVATTAGFPEATAPPSKEPDDPSADRADPRRAGSPLAAELNAPTGNAAHDVETLHALLRQYLRHLHQQQGLPIGNDTDLARALTGHNPMHLIVIPANHPAITSDGHLRDRWGTPYFIHPRGNDAFEIRSAGPDRKLFTMDDVVENPLQKKIETEN
jgi:hypothetical protein